MKAMFLRHEGYLGAVGAFIKDHQFPEPPEVIGMETSGATSGQSSSDQLPMPRDSHRHSSKCWSESFATSLITRSVEPSSESIALSEFELEHLSGMSLEPFPLLLSPADYVPDTWDLTQDSKARIYWLECFKVSLISPSDFQTANPPRFYVVVCLFTFVARRGAVAKEGGGEPSRDSNRARFKRPRSTLRRALRELLDRAQCSA